jgi:quinol monooxygenase YgiN
VNAEDRDEHVAAFRDLVSRARDFDGCLHFAMTADSVDPERVNLIEVWRDGDVLGAWRKAAKAPRRAKPKYLDVRQYEATDGVRVDDRSSVKNVNG